MSFFLLIYFGEWRKGKMEEGEMRLEVRGEVGG